MTLLKPHIVYCESEGPTGGPVQPVQRTMGRRQFTSQVKSVWTVHRPMSTVTTWPGDQMAKLPAADLETFH